MILHRLAFLLLLFTITNIFTPVIVDSHCALRDFQTTRLKSTAGAGVGSILLEEAGFLNPASLGFYQTSSVYYQSINSDHKTQSDIGINTESKSEGTAFILSDTGGGVNGSFSYIKQANADDKREQFGITFAKVVGENSSIGGAVLIRKDKLLNNGEYFNDDYELVTLGVSHILSEELSFGLSVSDILREKEGQSKITVGIQYVYGSFLTFMFDLGADYKENLEENYLYRTAGQVRFLNDFFLRFGVYNDKSIQEKGSGIGIAWTTPKLSLEIAQNNITKLLTPSDIESDKISEATFSVSYRF